MILQPKCDLLLLNIGSIQNKIYQDLSNNYTAIDTPFWLALTAGYLKAKQYSVSVLDANAEAITFEETVSRIINISPRFISIVCYSQQANVSTPIMVSVGILCRMIKSSNPEMKIILSGWHPSSLPERTIREENCDFVIQGEGFNAYEMLLAGKKCKDIPGLWYFNNDVISHTCMPLNIQNLSEELSDIAWDLLPMNKYRAFAWMCMDDFSERDKFASIQTSIGCPYKCSYCAIHSVYGEHKIRYWSPEWVINQIEILVEKYNVKHLNIFDELFIFNPSHYLAIAKGIIKKGFKLNISAYARVDILQKIDFNSLLILKRAGFNWFKLGIETGSSRIRKNVSKDAYDINAIRDVIDTLRKANISICANYMFGLPGDDFESMQETLNFAIDLNCDFSCFFCTMAVPGSELYAESLKNKIPLPETWLGYASQSYEFFPLSTNALTNSQILEFRDYAFNTYFKNPRYINFVERKFGSTAKRFINEMAKINLRRRLLEENDSKN